MANQTSPRASAPSIDTDANRHPTFRQALRLILDQGRIEDGQVERLEVNTLASGEVTYRYWTVNAEEPEGGVIAPS